MKQTILKVAFVCGLLGGGSALLASGGVGIVNMSGETVKVRLILQNGQSIKFLLTAQQGRKYDYGPIGIRAIQWGFGDAIQSPHCLTGEWYQVFVRLGGDDLHRSTHYWRNVDILERAQKAIYIGAGGLEEPIGTRVGIPIPMSERGCEERE